MSIKAKIVFVVLIVILGVGNYSMEYDAVKYDDEEYQEDEGLNWSQILQAYQENDSIVLKNYTPVNNSFIFFAEDYRDYIQPEKIKTFSENVEFEKNGIRLLLKDKEGSEIKLNYNSDDEFCLNEKIDHLKGRKGVYDFWINPDMYIKSNLTGDCEDFSLTVASLLENKNIFYVIVAGNSSISDQKHWWVEFVYNDKIYFASLSKAGGFFLPIEKQIHYEGIFSFNKKIPMQEYKEDWYKNQSFIFIF
ncbi:MAG: hypothetical protein KAQ64_00730 [Candidatus Pacebacteria bacterium]|nr:hypothetical protein [Candidatus Paceibacterota bacterium]